MNEPFYIPTPQDDAMWEKTRKAMIEKYGDAFSRGETESMETIHRTSMHVSVSRELYMQFFLQAGYVKPIENVLKDMGLSRTALYKRMKMTGFHWKTVKSSPTFIDFFKKQKALKKRLKEIGIDMDTILENKSECRLLTAHIFSVRYDL